MAAFDHTSGSVHPVNGAAIYAESQGAPDAPVMLLLHGGLGTIADFNVITGELDGYRLVGIDSRGHGRSTLGAGPWTYQQVQEDVEQVLAALDITRCTVIGFSDGGVVGLRLAAAGHVQVEKLVLVGATWHPDNLAATRSILEKVTPDSWRTKFPGSYETYQRLNPQPEFDRLVPALVAGWLDEGATGHPGETVRQVSCPTLVVRGDDDHLTAAADAIALRERLRVAHYLNIPFAGHVAHEDGRAIFVQALREFLRR